MTRSWMRWSAWLCLSLMVWTVAAESTHIHPSQSEAVSCPICVLAHSARPALSAIQSAPVFAPVGLFQEQEVVAKARLDFVDLGIRGPPAAL
jgi:hypothetical protein